MVGCPVRRSWPGLPSRQAPFDREPRPRVRHLVGLIPHRAHCFQERALLAQVRAATAGGGTAVLTQVLTGLGGVGKTQLAAAAAEELIDAANLDAVVWVNARSRDDVVATFARAGHEIRGADSSDPEAATAIFLEWLAVTNRQWLVVFDDVTDPADLSGLWPPRSLTGRVVVTTRRRDAALTSRGQVIPVGVFTPAEANAYLAEKLADHREWLVEAEELAADVGYLPLMLGQAAAYIVDQNIACAEYRSRLAQAKALIEVVPGHGATPDDYRLDVAAALLLSVDVANGLRPAGLARPLLDLLSLLDPNAIPLDVVTAQATVEYLNAHRSAEVNGDPVDAQQARGALMCLARLNLVDVVGASGASQVALVHGLVQRAARDQAAADLITAAAGAAADALVEAWPEVQNDTGLAQQLRSNAALLRMYAGDLLWRSGLHDLLYRVGESLGEVGLVNAAAEHFERLVDEATARLGPDQADVLRIRNNLASWRGEAGDVSGAARLLDELLIDQAASARSGPPRHPDHPQQPRNLARRRWGSIRGRCHPRGAARRLPAGIRQ